MVEDALPGSADGFALAGDFDAVREPLFELIGALCREDEDDGADAAPCCPSDLESLDAACRPAERAELYDNLIFNRYLDTDGTVLWTEFFADPANVADFWVNADIGAVGARGVAAAAGPGGGVRHRAARPRPRDLRRPAACAADEVERLLENLRVNGHLDGDGNYVDKRALLALPPRRAGPRAGVLPASPGDPRRDPGAARRAPGRALHDVPRRLRATSPTPRSPRGSSPSSTART